MASSLDFSISSIFSSIIFGIVGMWLVRQGKRNLNFRILAIGLAMMFYPYFTKSIFADWSIGIGLCGLAYYLW